MALTPGTRFGPYEISGLIGSGGMGEVYRATDTTLKRQVAVKVLPAVLAADADRLARFQREAEVLAALNHANIASIFGLEDAAGTKALVMEFVDGPTLAERIAQGPIPVDEALPIARQIVEALEAAHEQGIIHRDLKPANIKLTARGAPPPRAPDGGLERRLSAAGVTDWTVKVLDFGLAKILDAGGRGPATGAFTQSPTITTPAMTQAGVILGTAAYMSPEQARGKNVDKRADIWAFGCVLHEMLSGRRLYEGDEVSDTLAFVLTKEPDWSALPSDTPPAILRLLRRCLVKDRSGRLPDIGSARLDIDDARAELSLPKTGAPAGEPRRRDTRTVVAWALGSVALAALAAITVWMTIRARPSNVPLVKAWIGIAPAERLLSGYPFDPSLGLGRPSRTVMAFSPDGRSLVFSAEREGRVQLYLRRLDQLEATVIGGTEGASNPFFSPDGQFLGFHAGSALKKVPLGGGPIAELCSVDAVYGASWSRTDQIVFARANGGLLQVPATGGTPAQLTTLQQESGEVSHRLPHFLPDGQTVLFTVTKTNFPSWDDTQIAAHSLATGTRTVLVEGGADARYVATRHLIYVRRGTLMAVPFDPARLEARPAAAAAIVADVMQAASIQPLMLDTGAGQFAVSESGALAYVTGGVFPQNRWSLVWIDRSGRTEPLRVDPGAYLAPRLSPDGKRVAFASTTGDWDLWTYDIARGLSSRLPMEGEQSVPLWTADGSRLVFSSLLKGVRSVMSVNADGIGSPSTLVAKNGGWPNTWTADGSALGTFLEGQLWLVAPDGRSEPKPVKLSERPASAQFDFSPDGRWLAYDSRVNPQVTGQVYVHSYPGLDRREQVSTGNGGAAPAWRHDGRELFYAEDASADGPLRIRMMAVPIATTPTFSAATPRMLFEGPFRMDGPFRGYDVTPDGQRFLMVREIEQPPTRVSHMVLVQNWLEELNRLVPVK